VFTVFAARCKLLNWACKGRNLLQAVIRLRLLAGAWIRSQVSPRDICRRQRGTAKIFFPRTSVTPPPTVTHPHLHIAHTWRTNEWNLWIFQKLMLLRKPGALDRSIFTCYLVFKGLLLSLTTLELHRDIPVRHTNRTGNWPLRFTACVIIYVNGLQLL
jgi:hypothetical protein